MDWVTATMIMFFCSIGMYTAIRKSTLQKTPQQYNNIAAFFIPSIIFFLIYIFSGNYYQFTITSFSFVVFQGFFFAYLGNVFSLKGMEYSPNPGYSLVIQKSYVVLTSVVSIFLFNSTLTIQSVIAILLIIGFSALIIVDKSKDKKSSNKLWLPYTFGAFFCYGLLALSAKYLINMGMPITLRLAITMFITSAMIIGEVSIKKISIGVLTRSRIIVFAIIALLFLGFNYYAQVAFDLAPNIGYVNAANAASVAFLTLASAYFFKDELNKRKLIGIIGVTIGLIILVTSK